MLVVKTILTMLAVLGIVALISHAQDAGAPAAAKPIVPTNAIVAAPKAVPPDQDAAATRLIELQAQAEVLKVLAEEHSRRAQEARDDRTRWETELSKELAEKSAALTAAANKLRAAKAPVPAKAVVPVGVRPLPAQGGGSSPAEVAFLSKLDERLSTVEQELAAAMETEKYHTFQILTNSSPEELVNLSVLLDESSRVLKQLRKEASDLELRKLEFRALRGE